MSRGDAAAAAMGERLSAFRHRNFRLFFAGQLVSVIGTWMQSVAQGWLMHRLTASAFMLGLLGFVQFLPVMLLSLWAGVMADQVDKRRLILVTQAIAFLQAIAMALVVSTGVVQPWMVLALALVFGVVSAFDLPARQSFLVELVGKEDLPNAIALNSALFNAARVVGPAIAGVLLATTGEQGCFWTNAASYVAVLVGLSLIRMPERPRERASSGRGELWAGVRYAWGIPSIRNLLLLLGCTAGLGFQFMVLAPVFAREILASGPRGYGLMVSAFGVGSLVSAVVMTRRQTRWDLRRNLLVGLATSGIGMTVFAWSRAFPLTLAAALLAGFGLILYVASTNTLLQLTTEDRYRGRVMSLYTLMFIGTAPIGALLTGAVAQGLGAPAATTMNGAILLAGAVWVRHRLRVLAAREAARPTEPAMTERVG